MKLRIPDPDRRRIARLRSQADQHHILADAAAAAGHHDTAERLRSWARELAAQAQLLEDHLP